MHISVSPLLENMINVFMALSGGKSIEGLLPTAIKLQCQIYTVLSTVACFSLFSLYPCVCWGGGLVRLMFAAANAQSE